MLVKSGKGDTLFIIYEIGLVLLFFMNEQTIVILYYVVYSTNALFIVHVSQISTKIIVCLLVFLILLIIQYLIYYKP